MSFWVLDTDHVSLALRGNPKVIAQIAKLASQVTITIVTVQETFNGWAGQLNRPENDGVKLIGKYHQLFLAMELFKQVPILEFDQAAYDQYFSILQQNPSLRKKRLEQDLRIAAIALSHGAVVVTRNQRDFGLVPKLVTEDWSM